MKFYDVHEMFSEIIKTEEDKFINSITVDYSDDYTNLLICLYDRNNDMYSFDLEVYDSEYVSYVRKFINFYNKNTKNNTSGYISKLITIKHFYKLFL